MITPGEIVNGDEITNGILLYIIIEYIKNQYIDFIFFFHFFFSSLQTKNRKWTFINVQNRKNVYKPKQKK